MDWLLPLLCFILGVATVLALAVALTLFVMYFVLLAKYLDYLVRIFQEKPLFVIPRGQPVADAEDVRLTTQDGLSLRGCYLRTKRPRRRGVILFGLEYGSNRWSCVPYCEFLLEQGFDVFAFEPRSQGDSDKQPGYEPMQWVTEYELRDFEAAIAYMKARPDADPRGVGFFGISKGGSAGLIAAARHPYLRCFVTDGIFATHTTMVPYMRKWIQIYSKNHLMQKLLPTWYYGLLAKAGLRRIRRERGLRFPHLEHALPRLTPRPLLMIHGGADNYIKPEMAQALYARVRGPKELWLVEGAKHNQAFHTANGEYRRRVLAFFQEHLAGNVVDDEPDRVQAAAPPAVAAAVSS